ncbi:uncharacterized protein LOC142771825 [Rhipicephalus microplus]|uniref:uncharacterized protein LOC142771825 n=1 Tax=Rhipicephalus microplus TaxID=6941 RepID=UPI003F6CE53C
MPNPAANYWATPGFCSLPEHTIAVKFLADLENLNFWDVTCSVSDAHGSAQSFLARHVDVMDCLPWARHITSMGDDTCASPFELPQTSVYGNPLLCRSVNWERKGTHTTSKEARSKSARAVCLVASCMCSPALPVR